MKFMTAAWGWEPGGARLKVQVEIAATLRVIGPGFGYPTAVPLGS